MLKKVFLNALKTQKLIVFYLQIIINLIQPFVKNSIET